MVTLIFKNKERLPLGNNSRGRFVPPTKDHPAIFVPSYGVLEKEEIDYIVEAEKEKTHKRKSNQKEELEKITQLALNSPKGERSKTIKEVMDARS